MVCIVTYPKPEILALGYQPINLAEKVELNKHGKPIWTTQIHFIG